MKTDIQGRVRNVALAANKPLMPLFEAIVNSIHAIEDAKEQSGEIRISILRQESVLTDRSMDDVIGFEVNDNGVGFNDDNYESFQTSDSMFKANRGGKGIGRFFWLVAFKEVTIESYFTVGDKTHYRTFDFVASGDGIKDHDTGISDKQNKGTTIKLHGYLEKYKETCPKRAETIATYIVEHCLEYFIGDNCPNIILSDKGTGIDISLNEFYENQMAKNSAVGSFKIREYDFRITHVQLHSTHIKDHKTCFCAHHRVVKSENLAGKIPDLSSKLSNADGEDFVYAAYIKSDFLDLNVNAERMDFNIGQNDSSLFPDELSWKQIRNCVIESVKIYLAPYLEPVKYQKKERISRFVSDSAPMYHPMMKHIEDRMDAIDPNINDDELDVSLYKVYHDIQIELKEEGQLLQDAEVTDETLDDYKERMKQYFEKVTDMNKTDLARYVCHRKAILEFMNQLLSVKEDGKYRREDQIHNVIFPMGKTSNDILFEDHNLWLIDERLVYHSYIASDKPLKSLEPIESKSGREPDIIVFDKACALTTAPDPPFTAITIIELKKPMLKGYTDDKNPIKQVCDYIDEINSGKAKTPEGRPVPIQKELPFYCFIVCDDVTSLSRQAKYFELTKTPDNQGYFGYKKDYNAYFEIISYTKMVTDAKKRNAAFFDKLGLSSAVSRKPDEI